MLSAKLNDHAQHLTQAVSNLRRSSRHRIFQLILPIQFAAS